MKLIIAEKPSVAKSIASALGASSRADGFYEGNNLLVSWCVGHLVSPLDAGGYDERFKKWRYDDLPILPEPFRYVLAPGKDCGGIGHSDVVVSQHDDEFRRMFHIGPRLSLDIIIDVQSRYLHYTLETAVWQGQKAKATVKIRQK